MLVDPNYHMVYLAKKRIKGKEYFYLISKVRVNDGIKKFQIYLGKKRPLGNQLLKYSNILKNKIKNFNLKTDPLLKIIKKIDLNNLKIIKKDYAKSIKYSPAIKQNYYEWFIAIYTYDSNAIEGSTLTLRETAMLLFEDITPSNKSIRDVIAAENHKKAYDWICNYKGDVSKRFILKLHKILTDRILSSSASGKLRNIQVYIRGASETPPKAKEVTLELNSLLKWYNNNKNKYHPVVVAAHFHTAFEGIHPFIDFNGRCGRLILNFILLKNSYPPINIRNKSRQQYYKAIKSAINVNLKPFIELIIKYLKESNKVFK